MTYEPVTPKYMIQIMTGDPATAKRLLHTRDSTIDEVVLFQSAPGLPGMLMPVDYRAPNSTLHFVGFTDAERYWQAVQIFGEPDFNHRTWDYRAKAEIMEGDVAVFAKYDADTSPSPYSWDDSNQPDDPAAKERT